MSKDGGPNAAAFVWPILPGRSEAWRRFMQEMLGARQREVEEMYGRMGITREMVWLAHLPDGEVAILYLEAGEPQQVMRSLAESRLPFDRWYVQCIHKLHGIDMDNLPAWQPGELIFAWQGGEAYPLGT